MTLLPNFSAATFGDPTTITNMFFPLPAGPSAATARRWQSSAATSVAWKTLFDWREKSPCRATRGGGIPVTSTGMTEFGGRLGPTIDSGAVLIGQCLRTL